MSKLSLFIKNQISFFWLPAAWICGVRVDLEESNKCVVRVKLGFINKNPFKSLFWAVQGMAAEMPGGLLIQNKIKSSGQNIAMLLVGSSSKFTKKSGFLWVMSSVCVVVNGYHAHYVESTQTVCEY